MGKEGVAGMGEGWGLWCQAGGPMTGSDVAGHAASPAVAAIRSNAARGTRSSRPTCTTGRPVSPPVKRQRWQSRYAEVRPIRSTAAASSTVRKSGRSPRVFGGDDHGAATPSATSRN